jgi:hypothetical protein
LTVDPSSDVVGPSGNVLSLDHFALSSPLSVWENPLSVDLSSIEPVTFERYNSDWEVKFMELIALVGIRRCGSV